MYSDELIGHILMGEGIRNYPQDLRQLSAAELQALFAFTSSGRVNTTRVIKNLIWQAYSHIRDGQRPPIAGNLRSFWYTDVKPVLSRLGLPVEGRRATELVYDAFVRLVTDYHLFHYRDFGFVDEAAQTRTVGQTNGAVILFAEKTGRFALVRDLAQAYWPVSSNGTESYATHPAAPYTRDTHDGRDGPAAGWCACAFAALLGGCEGQTRACCPQGLTRRHSPLRYTEF
jgi:hypothetical protein